MHKKNRLYIVMSSIMLALLLIVSAVPEQTSASTITASPIEIPNEPAGFQWDSATATTITLNGDTITVTGDGAVVSGSMVTIVAAAAYNISGTLTDGQVVVDTTDEGAVGLILNNATINNTSSAPIYVVNAEAVEIILEDGTENVVSDGAVYSTANTVEDEPNAAIFSKADLTISGNGSLNVSGSYNDGIASKDGLIITGGTIVVNAADDGIRGKDYIIVYNGQISVNAQGDGLKSDNIEDATLGYVAVEAGTVTVNAGGDAITAETHVLISDGTFTLTAGGGSSYGTNTSTSTKGIKGTTSVTINGGIFTIDAADDAIHADNSIVINGGIMSVASGDDGIHADLAITINAGYVNITQAYEGIESKSIIVNDGNILVTTSDDGFNAAAGTGGGGTVGDFDVTINGGYIVLNTGGDGFDSNGVAAMTGGTLIVNGPSDNRNSAIDVNGDFNITGGLVVAVGSSGMAEAPATTSTQNSLMINFETAMPAGTVLHIESSDGNEILTFKASKAFQSLVVSSPALVSGATYNVSYGGSTNGVATDSIYPDGSYSGGTQYTSFTISSTVTTIGQVSSGQGGRGGSRGGGQG